MKKLSKEEMKNVQGGEWILTGVRKSAGQCYCDFMLESGYPSCDNACAMHFCDYMLNQP